MSVCEKTSVLSSTFHLSLEAGQPPGDDTLALLARNGRSTRNSGTVLTLALRDAPTTRLEVAAGVDALVRVLPLGVDDTLGLVEGADGVAALVGTRGEDTLARGGEVSALLLARPLLTAVAVRACAVGVDTVAVLGAGEDLDEVVALADLGWGVDTLALVVDGQSLGPALGERGWVTALGLASGDLLGSRDTVAPSVGLHASAVAGGDLEPVVAAGRRVGKVGSVAAEAVAEGVDIVSVLPAGGDLFSVGAAGVEERSPWLLGPQLEEGKASTATSVLVHGLVLPVADRTVVHGALAARREFKLVGEVTRRQLVGGGAEVVEAGKDRGDGREGRNGKGEELHPSSWGEGGRGGSNERGVAVSVSVGCQTDRGGGGIVDCASSHGHQLRYLLLAVGSLWARWARWKKSAKRQSEVSHF